MYSTAEFKKGLKIELEGVPYTIVDFQHVKPGKGEALVRTKMKSLLTGRVLKRQVMEREMQYLYGEGADFHMMDSQTYEQIILAADQVGEVRQYLSENMAVKVLFFNQQPVGVEVPLFVELEVTQTEPGVKGDTAAGGTEPDGALESGVTIQVPLFINEGDRVKVDTRTGSYIERVK